MIVGMKKVSPIGAVEHLSKLVSFQTVSGCSDEVDTCFDYLEDYLSGHNLHLKRITSDGFPSLFATTRPTTAPTVLLQAHIDVVPAKATSFTFTEKAGKLYGRGVYDMKFAAACYLQLVDDLKANLGDYDFGIMFTSDEEINGKNGVCYLLEKGYGAEVCILPDGGNDWHIETTCNAVWITRLVSEGVSAHGSRPWEGRNAINNLVEALGEIRSLFGELEPFKNSITISKIQGGEAINQVPDQAEATIDMRFTSDHEYAANREKIENIAKDRKLTLKTVAYVASRNVDTSQPTIKEFLDIAAHLHGQAITKTHSFGASDACYFANHGIPTIVIRPNGGGAHSDHEWIDKAELLKFYELIKTYVIQTTKVG